MEQKHVFLNADNGINRNKDTVRRTLVNFTDSTMFSKKHSGHHGGFFSRRNKCLLVTLVLTIGFLVLVLNAGVFTSAPTYTGALCKLNDIKLQKNFDSKQFAGSWFGAYTKGLSNKLLASLLEFSDVKMHFILKDEGKFDVKSVGGKFLGMWCPQGEGHMESRDPEHPQRLSVFFDTPTGKKFGTKPAWVLKTDYTSYAVLYSCWEETGDGYCAASGAYAVLITRSREPLPQSKMDEVTSAIASSCINPKSLRPVKHDGYCKGVQREITE